MDVKEISEKIQTVFRKYHLTPRQTSQVNSMVFALCRGKNVAYIAPRKGGQTTVYKATMEIAGLLQAEGALHCHSASEGVRGISKIQILHDSR